MSPGGCTCQQVVGHAAERIGEGVPDITETSARHGEVLDHLVGAPVPLPHAGEAGGEPIHSRKGVVVFRPSDVTVCPSGRATCPTLGSHTAASRAPGY